MNIDHGGTTEPDQRPRPGGECVPETRAADIERKWAVEAAEREAGLATVGSYPVAGLVRRARRIADLSQRQLARRAGLAPSTVGRIESGSLTPTLAAFQRILACAGLSLVVVDSEGHLVLPIRGVDATTGARGYRYPAHLDTILDPRSGEWWGDYYGLTRPPETYHRERRRRDEIRAVSRWEVRAKDHRGVWPPEHPDKRDARIARMLRRGPGGPDSFGLRADEVDVDEWDGPDEAPPDHYAV